MLDNRNGITNDVDCAVESSTKKGDKETGGYWHGIAWKDTDDVFSNRCFLASRLYTTQVKPVDTNGQDDILRLHCLKFAYVFKIISGRHIISYQAIQKRQSKDNLLCMNNLALHLYTAQVVRLRRPVQYVTLNLEGPVRASSERHTDCCFSRLTNTCKYFYRDRTADFPLQQWQTHSLCMSASDSGQTITTSTDIR